MKIDTNINPTEAINVIHQAFKRYETDPQPSSALSETEKTIQNDFTQGTALFGV